MCRLLSIILIVGIFALSSTKGFAEINEFGFDPASLDPESLLDLAITPKMGRESGEDRFIYAYEVKNQLTSKQMMTSIEFEIGDDAQSKGGSIDLTKTSADNPEWNSYPPDLTDYDEDDVKPDTFTGHTLFWSGSIKDDRPATINDLYVPPAYAIKQGERIGITFQSKGLPKISRFWASGWVRPLNGPEILKFINHHEGLSADSAFGDVEEIPRDLLHKLVPGFRPWYQNRLEGKTIAPYLPPIGQTVVCDTFILDLIAQVREAASLSWIKHDLRKDDDNRGKGKGDDKGVTKSQDDGDDHADDDVEMGAKDKNLPGVAKSIIKKLTKVRRECLRGRVGNAREKLRALLRQVNAQRGKHLTEEAYALIKFNVEFLLEKL